MARNLRSGVRQSLKPSVAGGLGSNDIFTTASLDLNFAKYKNLGPLVDATTGTNLIDFTRASSGTYVGSDGLIETATTNLALRSEKLDDAAWLVTGSGATIAAVTDIAAPNGTMTAWTLTSSGAVAQIQQTYTGINGATYTGSFWIRRRSGTGTVNIRVAQNVNIALAGVTSDWQRFSFTVASTSTTIRLGISLSGIADAVDLWGAQLEQSSTVGEYVKTTSTINSAPRFDHNPTTGESLGLLVEEQRTNSIRNNTMVGAVAGTPGTLPTNWSEGLAGLTRQVVGIGVENGISYIDIRLSGTSTGTQALLRWDGGITAANGQSWAHSVWLARTAGTLPSGNIALALNLFDASSVYLGDANAIQVKTAIGSSLSRIGGVHTISTANTATARPYIYFLMANGEAVDFTLRIGMPQLEQGSFATSVIPTTGSTVTRAADVASISGSNFSSWYRQDEGTVFAESERPDASRANTVVASITDGTGANRIELRSSSATNDNARFEILALGSGQFTNSSLSSNTAYKKIALAYAVNNVNAAANGNVGVTDTAASIPVVSQLYFGNDVFQTTYRPGHIKRLTYWPTRLPNETLQTITN